LNHLLRELAPVTDEAWAQIETEARTRLTTFLAARRLVDFTGPHGWDHAAHNLGQTVPASSPGTGVEARTRRVRPFVELRVRFTLARSEVDNAARGDVAIDLTPLDEAARAIGVAENRMVFSGYPDGQIDGIIDTASKHIEPSTSWDHYPQAVAKGVEELMLDGVGGPYGLALSGDVWAAVVETTEHGGYPLMEHLTKILDGPIVLVPGLAGGVVVSQRGGDFVFEAGQDISIGYLAHDAANVTLYLEESFSFGIIDPTAAVVLGAG
jgi:uncharacterized linocin/CFP29 family protein